MNDFDQFSETIGFRLNESLNDSWHHLTDTLRQWMNKATDAIDDEFSLPVSENQVNDALQKFVTDNVGAILELRVELHDDWLRLFCTVNVAGIYAEVAGNFGLVHLQLDRNVQRFVFEQKTYTDVLNLRCESFLKRQGIKLAIWFYHRVLKKDPLGFILSRINIARSKDNIIYLDIHRWLKKNKKIMTTLYKAQVNYSLVEEDQLVLKTQINYRDLISVRDGDNILSDKDAPDPELMKGPINPVDDATDPSNE